MNWKLPNQLTVGRIALAAGFFVLLGLYEQGSPAGPALLNAAFALYLIAGITDVLDGYLARKLNLVSAFGRIADPFVDKVLVVGAFAMLAGSNFAFSAAGNLPDSRLPAWLTGQMASSVQAWMVVVIMAREFIVSAVRGYSESCGIKFPATSAGKIKMFVQSLAICMVLVQMANGPTVAWAADVKVALVWLATIATVLSGLAYIGKARKLLTADE
ncbi:MAG: CDP-alcohol phosphatidyltransferase family protein [Phycisphaerae bacterium]|jgi:phosphatidylglycerophosphate synthase